MAIVSSPSAASSPSSSYGAIEPYAAAPPPPETQLPHGTTLLGTLVLLVADAMVLVALLAIWFTIKGGSPAWPPRGVFVGTYLPSTVTITAIMSSFSMAWAVSAIRRHDQRNGTVALVLTVILGLAVANAQWYTLFRADFGINDHAYGTLFFLLIGYHLLHQLLAVAVVVLIGCRALAGHFGRKGYDPLRAAAAFWQYTVVAWAVILTAVFLFSPHA